MKKILIIGDSLSLPGHKNSYEDTWVYKIKNKFTQFDYITFLMRSITTEVLVTMGGGKEGIDKMPNGADCLEFYNPDIVILELGIVDCAPRLFRKGSVESLILNRIPNYIRSKYIKLVKKTRKRNSERAEINPELFYNNLNNYFLRCKENKVQKVIIILICYPDNKMRKNNPEIGHSVLKYNNIYLRLSKEFNFIELCNPLDSRRYEQEIFEDGYHPNKIGNELVYLELSKCIENCLN